MAVRISDALLGRKLRRRWLNDAIRLSLWEKGRAALGPISPASCGTAPCLPIRVYYENTDFSARDYHASYLRFMERGRTELLRAVEVAQSDLHADMNGLAFVVRKMNIDFRGGAVMEMC